MSDDATMAGAAERPSVGRLTQPLVASLCRDARSLRLAVQRTEAGATIVDAGIAAAGPAEQLAHHARGVRALGQGVAVAAVGAGHVIVVGEVAAYAGGDGLLADVQVQEAADLALRVGLGRGLLEAADEEHFSVHREEFFGRRSCGW